MLFTCFVFILPRLALFSLQEYVACYYVSWLDLTAGLCQRETKSSLANKVFCVYVRKFVGREKFLYVMTETFCLTVI